MHQAQIDYCKQIEMPGTMEAHGEKGSKEMGEMRGRAVHVYVYEFLTVYEEGKIH